MNTKISVLLILSLITNTLYLSSCGTSNTVKGGAIGAVLGGGLGAAIGDKPGKEKEGAIIGTVVGGALGAYIGSRMDKQAEELKEVPGIKDVSYDEGSKKIDANMEVLFDFDKADIKPTEQIKLDQLAEVFTSYPENVVLIEGHTDSDGTDEYNQKLSERRAAAIENYMRSKQLDIANLSSVGYGESQPIAPNDTKENKAKNRRVEIKISADENRARQLYESQQIRQ
jgi:outer membrane protein OmpA-like peptidoglycan-associated protein